MNAVPYDPHHDPGKWRSRRIWSAVRWFVVYCAVGLYTVIKFGRMPWSLILGLLTDAILVAVVLKGVRVWDSRVWHADGHDVLAEPLKQCSQRRGHWRCAGMSGHVGEHIFGLETE